MKEMLLVALGTWLMIAGTISRTAQADDDRVQAVIDKVEKACIQRTIYMIGPAKARRLAELVRQAKPDVVVECGTAVGYSGLWIARELKAAGSGRLITLEINPERAREAEASFRAAGLQEFVSVKVGDARQLVKEIEGPIDFVFIDCGYSNYLPCLAGLEEKLSDGATVVADNVGIGAGGMKEYLDHVRSKYKSRTEWFELELPWAKRDAMEISVKTTQKKS